MCSEQNIYPSHENFTQPLVAMIVTLPKKNILNTLKISTDQQVKNLIRHLTENISNLVFKITNWVLLVIK